jgi:hypothetical protein
MLAHVKHRSMILRLMAVVASLTVVSACTSGDNDADADSASVATTSVNNPVEAAQLSAAMAPLFVNEGPLPIDDEVAFCLATGMVDTIGVAAFEAVGVTPNDADGPNDDVYSGLDRDQLADAVAVWSICADLPALVQSALVQSGPDQLDAGIDECLELGLSAGVAQRFLFDALANDTDPGGAVSDVLRLVDGCALGAQRPELADVSPGLWPWLTVGLPGYDVAVISPDDPEATALADFLANGGEQADGVALAALEVVTADGELAAALIVVAVERDAAGGLSAASYSAGVVASAGDAEVFPITLPGGAEVLGWEEPDGSVISLLWRGERIVVLATGPLTAADVLSLYTDLVPAP